MAKKSKAIPKGEEVLGSVTKFMDRNYLSSLDLIGAGDVKLEIDRVEHHDKITFANGNTKENALLMYFVGTNKPLDLNSTNIRAIIAILGTSQGREWKGKNITLAVKKVSAFSKTVDAVRVVG